MSSVRRPGASRSRHLVLGVAGGAVALLGGAYAAGYAVAGDNAPREASVSGVRIGGLPREAAIQKLTAELGPALDRPVTLTAGDASKSAPARDFGLGIDYAASVERAGAGRSWNPAHIVTVLTGGGETPAAITTDQAALAASLATLTAQLDAQPVNAGITVDKTTLRRTEGKPGTVVDVAGTGQVLAAEFLKGQPVAAVVVQQEPEVTTAEADEVLAKVGRPALAAPVTVRVGKAGSFDLTPAMIATGLGFVPENGTLAPRLDPDNLGKTVAPALAKLGLKQPKDATITIANGKPKIVASVAGDGIDTGALATAVLPVLSQPTGRTVSVGTAPREAAFTTADAKKLGVEEVTGKFTTYFPGTAYRYNNIPKAARLINGTFLKPGETFSMNKTLGYRSTANGWMAGGAIDGGKVVTRMGGGISQATTTTFNAIFFAGLKDVYHKPHSLYFNRYPVGREATLDWDSVDMKFTNDSPYGVVLQAYTTGKYPNQGSITVKVWSTKVYTIKASTPVRSNYRSPGATVYDTSPGCVPQSAMSGFDVRFKRLFYKGGKLVKTEPFFWRYSTLTPVVCGKKPGA